MFASPDTMQDKEGTEMDRYGMGRWTVAVMLFASALLSGCAQVVASNPADVDGRHGLTVTELPQLPGCNAVSGSVGHLTASRIAGVRDLYLVEDNGTPLCIDDAAGVTQLGGSALLNVANSSSDPMPGKAASDPMPGKTGSDPMPGKGGSDPMPGRAKRPGE